VDTVSASGLTIVIPTKDLAGMLQCCLEHLQRALKVASQFEPCVVVVDNATQIPLLEKDLPSSAAHLIRFDLTASFAEANNTAIRRYPNAYYLLLNNEVLLAESALADMQRLLEEMPNAGLCGTRLISPDGTIQHAGVVFGPGAIGPYHVSRGQPSAIVSRLNGEFQAVTGACLLIRQSTWDDLGGLSGEFAFGLEDIDFCLRARQKGWRVFCSRRTDSLHFESMTPGMEKPDNRPRRAFMNKWRGRYAIDGQG
jgi:GT2 family glycosyltransferase